MSLRQRHVRIACAIAGYEATLWTFGLLFRDAGWPLTAAILGTAFAATTLGALLPFRLASLTQLAFLAYLLLATIALVGPSCVVDVYDAAPSERVMAFAGRAATNCSHGVMGTWETALTIAFFVAIGSWLCMAWGLPFRLRDPRPTQPR